MDRLFFVSFATLVTFVASCGGGTGESDDPKPASDFAARGPSEAGVMTAALVDDSRQRTLPIEIWYPAMEGGNVSAVIDFETDPDRRGVLASLLEDAPSECVTTTTGASRDAQAVAGNYPVVLFSHCYTCTRWSAHFLMERLASHGFIVVAPGHVGDTLFDREEGNIPPLDEALLATRVADVRFTLDRVLVGDVLPTGASVDPSRIGMLGHSLGSVTSGAVAQVDDRIAAVGGLAAPMDNPLIPGVSIEAIDVPLALLVATEDNSVGEAGNIVTRRNFEDANPPAYKLEVVDAGHFGVTNIAGLGDAYAAGCGDGLRQQSSEPFTYAAVDLVNESTATFITAFFAAHLDGNTAGFDRLDPGSPEPWPSDVLLDARIE
jgi:dienelactone hydrolase